MFVAYYHWSRNPVLGEPMLLLVLAIRQWNNISVSLFYLYKATIFSEVLCTRQCEKHRHKHITWCIQDSVAMSLIFDIMSKTAMNIDWLIICAFHSIQLVLHVIWDQPNSEPTDTWYITKSHFYIRCCGVICNIFHKIKYTTRKVRTWTIHMSIIRGNLPHVTPWAATY